MILVRLPGRSRRTPARAAAFSRAGASSRRRSPGPASSRTQRPFSPLGPAMVAALGGVIATAVRGMRARDARRRAAGVDRDRP